LAWLRVYTHWAPTRLPGGSSRPRPLIQAADTQAPNTQLTSLFAWRRPPLFILDRRTTRHCPWHFSVHTFANQCGGEEGELRKANLAAEPVVCKILLTSSSGKDTRSCSTSRRDKQLTWAEFRRY